MVVYYQIAGKKVGSHYLAMGVLGALFGGVKLAMGGGSQPKPATPPIQASSKDEEEFITYVAEAPKQAQCTHIPILEMAALQDDRMQLQLLELRKSGGGSGL
ncbi:ATP19 family protein [Aspergillus fijiensis CBS 313.89]|uniref:Uncharacterized protein n=1 Tax=Aspergillus fijiensis CBS 313.89 TaxID=1448319 RepID=A0A8G1VTX4_9EURO|nr:uncharacterized protein BO72DRAFT_453654 [Aspergillus fijiensis CBS 313.89]RAK71521.1 hypothetical protein BO72DRAFT_453654 [Aspergillus fijiensis CBS 313.89]